MFHIPVMYRIPFRTPCINPLTSSLSPLHSHLFSPPASLLLSFASTSRLSTSTPTSRPVLYLSSSASLLLPPVFCLLPPASCLPPPPSSPPPGFRLRPVHHCRGCGQQANSSGPNPTCSSAASARRSARISAKYLNRQGPDRTCVRFGPVMP